MHLDPQVIAAPLPGQPYPQLAWRAEDGARPSVEPVLSETPAQTQAGPPRGHLTPHLTLGSSVT